CVRQRSALGDRAGHTMRRLGSGCGYAEELPACTGPRCASVHGFALHANTQVPAPRQDQLERLMRSTNGKFDNPDLDTLKLLSKVRGGDDCTFHLTNPVLHTLEFFNTDHNNPANKSKVTI